MLVVNLFRLFLFKFVFPVNISKIAFSGFNIE